jgi:large subunit ribosomal protein L6e
MPPKGTKKASVKGHTHNPKLIYGLNKHSKSKMYNLAGRRFVKTKIAKKVARVAPRKAARFYAVDVAPKPLKRTFARNPTKLRASITPGTVLIVLTGSLRGKRVVFLKQLPSGLLLVTGPFKINGVPLRRVNQAYVIATSTKVGDISKVDLSAVTDAHFKKSKADAKKPADKFFEAGKEAEKKKSVVSDEFKALQKKVDEAILPFVKQTPLLKDYLSSTFGLSNGQFPHLMKF